MDQMDHHFSNQYKFYCNLNYVEGSISSCCQVIYYILKSWDIEISKEIGESLISGVLTDTNGFGNIGVDNDTFKMTSELIDLGIDIHEHYKKLLFLS